MLVAGTPGSSPDQQERGVLQEEKRDAAGAMARLSAVYFNF